MTCLTASSSSCPTGKTQTVWGRERRDASLLAGVCAQNQPRIDRVPSGGGGREGNEPRDEGQGEHLGR